jgi:hypothetical protein
MKVISKDKIDLTSRYYFQYSFDNGYKYWVWDNDALNAYTATGRYPSKKIKQKMERIISEWEDRRVQFPN